MNHRFVLLKLSKPPKRHAGRMQRGWPPDVDYQHQSSQCGDGSELSTLKFSPNTKNLMSDTRHKIGWPAASCT